MSEFWNLINEAEANLLEVEFTMMDARIYKGVPTSIVPMENENGDDYLDCTLRDAESLDPIVAIPLDDVVSVRRLDQPDTVIYAPKIAA